MIYILFGEMGCGKNYVGERLAKQLGCNFYDGDLAMPPEMKEKVRSFKFLSTKTIKDFILNHLNCKIMMENFLEDNLVVSQALYRKESRQLVARSIGDCRFIYVKPSSLRVHLARIMTRPNGFKWAAYCLLSKPFFERSDDVVIINDTDKHIDEQIKKIIT